jgi:hypothetical protein
MGDIVTSGAISKGVIHRKVDDLVNERPGPTGPFTKRAAFLSALRQATTSEAYLVLLQQQAGVDVDEAEYLRTKFYKNPNAWRADGRSVYAILHAGLVKALEEAGTTLPLDSYWLAAAGNKTTESIVCRSESQVTRIFLTPPIPLPRGQMPGRRTRDVPIWVLKLRTSPRERKDFVTRDAIVKAVQGKIVTWQRREFATGAEP